MRSSRLTALVLLAGLIAGGLVLDAADDPTRTDRTRAEVLAGVAMPAATPADTLTSTWYCAGGSATEGGIADHVLLLANPSERPRQATVTVLTGAIAAARPDAAAEPGGETTTTTEATTSTTTTTAPEPPAEPTVVEVPALSRVEVALADLVDAPLAGAIVEIDGGEVAVEHQVTGEGGVATAPCSSTAAREWSFPWGVTRGARELLVFMNPFPDDATVNIDFATDEGTRETLRFQNFVVPARSVVGAFIDDDTRRDQVSAQVHVGSGRLVVDRIQILDGTNPTNPALEGITLGLGAPSPAEMWMFPDGRVDEGITEQVVVFNASDEVAEIEVEVRLADAEDIEVLPEPFELTIPPNRFSIVDLHAVDDGAAEDAAARVPPGVAHSILVRSLNGVPVTAERVVTSSDPNATVGVSATLGAPLAAGTWYFPGGGVTEERSQFLTLFNPVPDQAVRFSVSALAGGQLLALQDLQDVELPAGGRVSIRLRDHVDNRESLPLVIRAEGPVVVERGLFRVAGRGMSQSMGIPLGVGVLVPDPLDG